MAKTSGMSALDRLIVLSATKADGKRSVRSKVTALTTVTVPDGVIDPDNFGDGGMEDAVRAKGANVSTSKLSDTGRKITQAAEFLPGPAAEFFAGIMHADDDTAADMEVGLREELASESGTATDKAVDRAAADATATV